MIHEKLFVETGHLRKWSEAGYPIMTGDNLLNNWTWAQVFLELAEIGLLKTVNPNFGTDRSWFGHVTLYF